MSEPFFIRHIVKNEQEERFLLPNSRFMVQIYYYNITVHCYVLDVHTNDTRETFSVNKRQSPKIWQYLVNEFRELAIKKYPRELHSHAGQRREDTLNRLRRILR